MDNITWRLYLNSIIYYIIMFVCPFVFVEPCGGGVNPVSHLIYATYAIIQAIFEVHTVIKIQRYVDDPNILKFNKWHFVEMIMGQIARFDTYLDICFINLLIQCKVWKLVVPVSCLVILYLIYPLYTLVKLSKLTKNFNHTQPKLERNCDLAFVRENMLLATVLDSFCIENNVNVCKKNLPFGRLMGIWTLVTQDGPQYLIHLLFMFVIHSEVDHYGLTIMMSLVCSTFAIAISIFNCIMCDHNEFDPALLEIELKKR